MATTIATENVYVTRTPGVCGAKPCIAGTRISINLIAELTLGGNTPDDIVSQIAHLTLAEVYGALAYYYEHRHDIDRSIQDGIRLVEEIRQRTGPGPFEAMLLARDKNATLPH